MSLKILDEMYVTFCKKQRNYARNISVGTDLKSDDDIKLSLVGLWFRMNDKIQRLKQLVLGQPDEVGENIQDTTKIRGLWNHSTDKLSKKEVG